MFTVARFWAPPTLLQALAEIGAEMNTVRPNVFCGIRKAGDGFSCDVSSSDSWSEHARQVTIFVLEFRQAIENVVSLGGRVTFDVAVEPEDHSLAVILLDQDLLRVLADAGLPLELSVYPR